MKINSLTPEDMISVVTRHLSGQNTLPETRAEKQLRQFLRGDDGTIAGILLHLSSMVSRSEDMGNIKYKKTQGARIDFSLRQRRKCLHIFIHNVLFMYTPPLFGHKNRAGRSIRLSLHFRTS
jgi:hypothetical protein